MSAPSPGDLVAGNLAGQSEMAKVLDAIQASSSHPDEIYLALLDIWGRHGNPGLLGAARRLQKVLERIA